MPCLLSMRGTGDVTCDTGLGAGAGEDGEDGGVGMVKPNAVHCIKMGQIVSVGGIVSMPRCHVERRPICSRNHVVISSNMHIFPNKHNWVSSGRKNKANNFPASILYRNKTGPTHWEIANWVAEQLSQQSRKESSDIPTNCTLASSPHFPEKFVHNQIVAVTVLVPGHWCLEVAGVGESVCPCIRCLCHFSRHKKQEAFQK